MTSSRPSPSDGARRRLRGSSARRRGRARRRGARVPVRAAANDVEVARTVADGDRVGRRRRAHRRRGRPAPLLAAERTALNFASHLSGVATQPRVGRRGGRHRRPGARHPQDHAPAAGAREVRRARRRRRQPPAPVRRGPRQGQPRGRRRRRGAGVRGGARGAPSRCGCRSRSTRSPSSASCSTRAATRSCSTTCHVEMAEAVAPPAGRRHGRGVGRRDPRAGRATAAPAPTSSRSARSPTRSRSWTSRWTCRRRLPHRCSPPTSATASPCSGLSGGRGCRQWRVSTEDAAHRRRVVGPDPRAARGPRRTRWSGIASVPPCRPCCTSGGNARDHFGDVRSVVVEPGVRTGVPVLTDNPREVGADRIINALAAANRYTGPTIVVDLTVRRPRSTSVSEKGQYIGGAIAPGIEISLEALGRRGAQLRKVELLRPRSVIAEEHGGGVAVRHDVRRRQPGGRSSSRE